MAVYLSECEVIQNVRAGGKSEYYVLANSDTDSLSITDTQNVWVCESPDRKMLIHEVLKNVRCVFSFNNSLFSV